MLLTSSTINTFWGAVYIETGKETNAGSMTFSIVDPGASNPQTRTWKVILSIFLF
jgi:hypothetical protein